ncbi:MAG: hypothetical protein FJ291_23050 [Planctomycetes bacterium]|nr:hypothetical protein [Planctomycetota bacterium]
MALLKPNDDDKRKLHAEVNQIVNQRLVLTTLAVTLFGGAIAWLIPRDAPKPGNTVPTATYLGALLLTTVLFALFVLAHHLARMMRTITAYLQETGASNWEKDWAVYRERFGYLGYTKPQAIVFLLLGILSSAFPLVISLAWSLAFRSTLASVCLIAGVAYALLVWGMGFRQWFANEGRAREQWRELDK